MEFPDSDMEELLEATMYSRFSDFCGEYRKIKKELAELELDSNDDPKDWESLGSLQDVVTDQMTKAPVDRDINTTKFLSKMQKAGFINFSVEEYGSFDQLNENILKE